MNLACPPPPRDLTKKAVATAEQKGRDRVSPDATLPPAMDGGRSVTGMTF